jgi:hypothetical protein
MKPSVTTKSVLPSEKNGPLAAKAGDAAERAANVASLRIVLPLHPVCHGAADGFFICLATHGGHDLGCGVGGNGLHRFQRTGADLGNFLFALGGLVTAIWASASAVACARSALISAFASAMMRWASMRASASAWL